LRYPERDALAGKRIDITPGIANQQHPASDSAGNSLPKWASSTHSGGGGGIGQPFLQSRKLIELLLERDPARA
jgi:hypothetical protein